MAMKHLSTALKEDNTQALGKCGPSQYCMILIRIQEILVQF